MKIYLASPLFTTAERDWNAKLAQRLRRSGLEIWLPQEQEMRESTARSIFLADLQGVDQADMVVAVMDGPDPDSGTCWECGYAYAKGKRVVTIRTDFRKTEDISGSPFNLMLSESAEVNLVLPLASIEDAAEKIVGVVRGFSNTKASGV